MGLLLDSFLAARNVQTFEWDVRIQRELFLTIRNGGKGDCGPAALWSLIYGTRPSSRDLKEMRNQAVDQVSSYKRLFSSTLAGVVRQTAVCLALSLLISEGGRLPLSIDDRKLAYTLRYTCRGFENVDQ